MKYLNPIHGQMRVIKGFAFFPVTANSRTKWLEAYFVKQSYDSFECRWRNNYFSNEKEYNLYSDGRTRFA